MEDRSTGAVAMKRRVGIMTWHYYSNFGSALQAYALQEAIKSLGYAIEVINYRDELYGKDSDFKRWSRYIISLFSDIVPPKLRTRIAYPFIHFQKRYLVESKVIYDEAELKRYARKFDVIVFGSDQIWAPNVFKPQYMACFLDYDKVKAISYAASIGLDYLPSAASTVYKQYLSKFSRISVRERKGQELLLRNCSIKSDLVLDPTFLLSINQYIQIEKKPSTLPGKYVFCYFLNENNNYQATVENAARSLGAEIIGFSRKKEDKGWLKNDCSIGPEMFLWMIHHAEMVFTDSYHGTIFSLMYHKTFYHFERFEKNDTINQNSRIHQLIDYFNFSQLLINEHSIINGNSFNYDYREFERLLKDLKTKSYSYLMEALG